MAKKNVAVYDGSNTYIKRFLKYVNEQNAGAMSLHGFSEIPALMEYLEKNRVDVLLFSGEGDQAEQDAAEGVCAELLDHPSVKEFVYLGERRNSKSQVKHIDKYQAAGNVVQELHTILYPEREEIPFPAREAVRTKAELISVFAPSPEEEAALCALEIAEMLAVRKEVLFLDLERFPMSGANGQGENGEGLSDLIYVYRNYPKKLTECLHAEVRRYHNLDILVAPEYLEDLGELPEKEWPDFLQQLAACGGYEAVVVYMAEAFRNPFYLFAESERIYNPTSQSERATEKMRRLAKLCCSKGRKDLYEKMQAVVTPSARGTNAGEESLWD